MGKTLIKFELDGFEHFAEVYEDFYEGKTRYLKIKIIQSKDIE